MKALKHICLMGLLSLMGVLFTACKNYGEAAYITEPTDIALTVLSDHITAGSAQVLIEPMDDRAYYFTRAVPANEYIPGTMDRDFMMLVMDSVYIHYLLWRYDLLRAGETYIAPFSSHSLKYGVQTIHVDTLTPDTEYMIYAFCVNPVTQQPMGDLFFNYFKTDSHAQTDLSFQFVLEGNAVYIMPSNDETQYVASYEETSVIKIEYHNDAVEFLRHTLDDAKSMGLTQFFVHRNAYLCDLYLMTPNKHYTLACAAYDGKLAAECATCEVYCDPDGKYHLVGQE